MNPVPLLGAAYCGEHGIKMIDLHGIRVSTLAQVKVVESKIDQEPVSSRELCRDPQAPQQTPLTSMGFDHIRRIAHSIPAIQNNLGLLCCLFKSRAIEVAIHSRDGKREGNDFVTYGPTPLRLSKSRYSA